MNEKRKMVPSHSHTHGPLNFIYSGVEVTTQIFLGSLGEKKTRRQTCCLFEEKKWSPTPTRSKEGTTKKCGGQLNGLSTTPDDNDILLVYIFVLFWQQSSIVSLSWVCHFTPKKNVAEARVFCQVINLNFGYISRANSKTDAYLLYETS